MRTLLFICICVAISLTSCDNSKFKQKINRLEYENQELRKSLKEVQKELDIYKYDPVKLCSNINQLYEKGNVAELINIQNTLKKYHPESEQYKTVTVLVNKYQEKLKKKAAEEKKQRMQAVNKLRKKYDDVSGITWYENPYFTHYNSINSTSIYIGKDKDSVWLRLKMSYNGDDWIFFENAYLSYDGNTQNIYFDKYKNKESDHNGDGVWEWIDVQVDNSLLTFLREMVNGKSLKMRLSGKYTKTRNLSTNEIKAIKDVLLAYDVLLKGE